MERATGRPYQKAFSTNSTATSFTSKVPTRTKPNGAGVLDLTKDGCVYPWLLKILPYAVGADNDTFDFRVIGWSHIQGDRPENSLWIPTIIAEISCTVGTTVGVAGTPVVNTERFADTITLIAARGTADYKIAAGTSVHAEIRVFTPLNQFISYIITPVDGYELVEFDADPTGTTTEVNALVSLVGSGA